MNVHVKIVPCIAPDVGPMSAEDLIDRRINVSLLGSTLFHLIETLANRVTFLCQEMTLIKIQR